MQLRRGGKRLAAFLAEPAVGVAHDDQRCNHGDRRQLPFTLLGRYLGFTALPLRYVPHLALTLVCYVLLTQSVKAWLLHRGFIR
jgi:hypothetical protein